MHSLSLFFWSVYTSGNGLKFKKGGWTSCIWSIACISLFVELFYRRYSPPGCLPLGLVSSLLAVAVSHSPQAQEEDKDGNCQNNIFRLGAENQLFNAIVERLLSVLNASSEYVTAGYNLISLVHTVAGKLGLPWCRHSPSLLFRVSAPAYRRRWRESLGHFHWQPHTPQSP